MATKSDAQKRYFHLAEGRGKAPPGVVREHSEKTADKELPEHATMVEGGEVEASCPHCGKFPSEPQEEADEVPKSGHTQGEDFAAELIKRRGNRGANGVD
jgi:hypothetical protein